MSISANVLLNVVFLYGTSLAQSGIALASSLSGWLNTALLAIVLVRRGQWIPDARLGTRSLGIAAATLGMGGALWAGLWGLAPWMAHASLVGVGALALVCTAGAAVYGLCGALLGVVKLSELRVVFRRPAGIRSADPGEQP